MSVYALRCAMPVRIVGIRQISLVEGTALDCRNSLSLIWKELLRHRTVSEEPSAGQHVTSVAPHVLWCGIGYGS